VVVAAAKDSHTSENPIVVNSAESATLQDLVAELRDERVVYVGETHTAYGDHLLQLDVLKGMAAQPGRLAVGVEWLQARFQPVLDAYLAGRIDEAGFLRDTQYFDRWRFDYRLYRPIVEYAKDNGIPLVALNASRELTDGISGFGIDGLPPELAAELPDGYDFGNSRYEAQLRRMFDMHPAGDGDFRRFLEVQLTWDETMAQSVAGYLARGDDTRMLVMAGKGHISGRNGIPDRVTRRTGIRGVTIAAFDPAARLFNEADYLVLAQDMALPPAGLMQVFLDETSEGVYIRDFSPGSPAEKAGIQKNDRIARIDGEAVRHFADVKVMMLDKSPGDEIELTVERASDGSDAESIATRFKLGGGDSRPG
jgi:uncharacterized iron-regulated protein